MDSDDLKQRLSRISTQWTLVFQAHGGQAEATTEAQRRLMQRYSGAAYRYLVGALRDAAAAEDLAQDFAVRFLRGDFRRANPERGRFRDYLKTALSHLVTDYHRARQAWHKPLAVDPAGPAASAADAGSQADFVASWREELLERTWEALAQANAAYHTVLLFRIDNPDVPSAEMAEQLAGPLGKPVNAAWVRKTAQRAQEKFAELLIEEVKVSLPEATPQELRDELQELDLLKYCKSAVDRVIGPA